MASMQQQQIGNAGNPGIVVPVARPPSNQFFDQQTLNFLSKNDFVFIPIPGVPWLGGNFYRHRYGRENFLLPGQLGPSHPFQIAEELGFRMFELECEGFKALSYRFEDPQLWAEPVAAAPAGCQTCYPFLKFKARLANYSDQIRQWIYAQARRRCAQQFR